MEKWRGGAKEEGETRITKENWQSLDDEPGLFFYNYLIILGG